MNEFDVILVPTAEQFHILNFPLTTIPEFESVYQLQTINYKPISTQISLQYAAAVTDDRLENQISMNSHVSNNRTYYTLAKLDEHQKRIYLYPITNFQNMRVSFGTPESQESTIATNKRYFKYQQELKSKEQTLILKQEDYKLPTPSKIQTTKQMSSNEYMKSVFDIIN